MKPLLLTILLLASASSLSAAPVIFTLQLDSVSSGVYNYSVTIPDSPTGLIELLFPGGHGISLTGLSGVTAASASGDLGILLGSVTFTDTSAFFFVSDPDVGQAIDLTTPHAPLGELHITSTSSTEELVSYDIQGDDGFTGTVLGPVAAPEPATVGLLGFSLLAGATWLRRSKRSC